MNRKFLFKENLVMIKYEYIIKAMENHIGKLF